MTGCSSFSDLPSCNFGIDRAAHILAAHDAMAFDAAKIQMTESLQQYQHLPRGERNQAYMQAGASLVRRYPLLFVSTYLRGMLKMLPGPCVSGLYAFPGFDSSKDHPLRDTGTMPLRQYAEK